jgi:pyruvate formate lyase activating enzyme
MQIKINGEKFEIPSNITIKKALEIHGFHLDAPCLVGGCYSCILLVDGKVVRACITKAKDGMEILLTELPPRRIIHGPQPHTVGGKATPWWLKSKGWIEVAIWTAGCNLRCPQCQNHDVTYDSSSHPVSPERAAELVTKARKTYKVNRMAISGGEPTLNKRWLLGYFSALKKLNPENARLHLDSNGTLLDKNYIDELVSCGVTDIGVEPKGVRAETFMLITGIKDKNLAEKYLRTAWDAIRYISGMEIFLGVGLPYNPYLITMEEVYEFGEKLSSIDSSIQLCVLDYFPAFKRTDLRRPSPQQMLRVKKTLEDAGLRTVIVQTSIGHIGP